MCIAKMNYMFYDFYGPIVLEFVLDQEKLYICKLYNLEFQANFLLVFLLHTIGLVLTEIYLQSKARLYINLSDM